MKQTFDEIQRLLSGNLGPKLEMDPGRITYKSENNPGEPIDGFRVGGVSETVEIPDEYMSRAGVNSSRDFLNWLHSQE